MMNCLTTSRSEDDYTLWFPTFTFRDRDLIQVEHQIWHNALDCLFHATRTFFQKLSMNLQTGIFLMSTCRFHQKYQIATDEWIHPSSCSKFAEMVDAVVENVRSYHRGTFLAWCWIQAKIWASLSSGVELWQPRNFWASSSFFKAHRTVLRAQSEVFPTAQLKVQYQFDWV
jgi:hypothetical protein